jgi:hypothetical protein
MTRARTIGTQLVVMIALVAGLSVLSADEKSVAGTWMLNAEGYTMSMVLTQNGKTLGGTLDSPHGPIALKGEIVDGTLTFTGSGGDAHPLEFTFKGALKSDGTLAGDLTSNVGDMSWTAVRESKR